MEQIKKNLEEIKAKMSAAAVKAGRKPEDVTLCAVSKTRTTEEINKAIDLGVTDIGENKVQEILDKYDGVKAGVRWHLIGHLQTNKVKYIIDKVCLIHSVDSLRLAEEISKRAAGKNKTMDILLQVNVGNDENKFGVEGAQVGELIASILESCPAVKIRGLMCIPPLTEDPEDARQYFVELRELYEKYAAFKHERSDFKYLSMGMSGDFEVAISEGSNLIRVGTAIFGERIYK